MANPEPQSLPQSLAREHKPLAIAALAMGLSSVVVIIEGIIQLARWRPKGRVDAKAG